MSKIKSASGRIPANAVRATQSEDGLWNIIAPLTLWQAAGYFANGASRRAPGVDGELARVIAWPEELQAITSELEDARHRLNGTDGAKPHDPDDSAVLFIFNAASGDERRV